VNTLTQAGIGYILQPTIAMRVGPLIRVHLYFWTAWLSLPFTAFFPTDVIYVDGRLHRTYVLYFSIDQQE
jgi:hypothetical protein